MKTVTIVGNRPQFIKASALWRAMKEWNNASPGKIEDAIIHTGQHYDSKMSDVFFEEMELPRPHYHFSLGGLPQGAMTGRMIENIEEVLTEVKPDWIIVFGDTNSTLAGSLAASKLHIPVCHIEAGLRSFNRRMPEEVNRVVTDHLSSLLCTPTESASRQLLAEGIEADKICRVGDIMYDAFLFYKEKAKQVSRMPDALQLKPRGYLLATVHRAENTDHPEKLAAIVEGLGELSQAEPVVLPLHPRTRSVLKKNQLTLPEGVRVIDPVGYFDMLQLASQAQTILTDSGGLQKEAYFCGVPCITLREETEWTELVEKGFNRLAPLSRKGIVETYAQTLSGKPDWSQSLYGDGASSRQILEEIARKA